ncbi:M48 family metallopeptidase, partial [Acinetobacter baumannii]
LMGVLAHELGHVHRRHLMRRLIQSSAIAATATLLFGDVSAVLANIPTVLLDLKYSRDIEREADDYAIAMFKANGLPRQKLALVFEKL